MGSGIMLYWINGPAIGGIEDKIKMANFLIENQYSSVPPFHYSISGTISEAQKNSYILSRL